MDRTSIIVLAICVIVMLSWTRVVNKIYPPKPLPPGATNSHQAAITSSNPGPTTTTTTTTSTTSAAPSGVSVPVANTNVAEEILPFDTEEARYTFSSYGGGLKLVELQIK